MQFPISIPLCRTITTSTIKRKIKNKTKNKTTNTLRQHRVHTAEENKKTSTLKHTWIEFVWRHSWSNCKISNKTPSVLQWQIDNRRWWNGWNAFTCV